MTGAVIIGVIFLAIVIRIMAGGLDGDRVKRYIESRGGTLLDQQWAPFGKGWFGEENDRIYKVRFRDGDGNIHEASCKTSMWSGVYLTEDRIVQAVAPPKSHVEPLPSKATVAELEAENRLLREQLERLRRGADADEDGDGTEHLVE